MEQCVWGIGVTRPRSGSKQRAGWELAPVVRVDVVQVLGLWLQLMRRDVGFHSPMPGGATLFWAMPLWPGMLWLPTRVNSHILAVGFKSRDPECQLVQPGVPRAWGASEPRLHSLTFQVTFQTAVFIASFLNDVWRSVGTMVFGQPAGGVG